MGRNKGIGWARVAAWVCLFVGSGVVACAQLIGADPVKEDLDAGVSSASGSASSGGSGGSASASGSASVSSSSGASSSSGVSSSSSVASSSSSSGGDPCKNGVKDGSESDVDCGGPTCPKCMGCKLCKNSMDCGSGCCRSFLCIINFVNCATADGCADGCQDGAESDKDCGGNLCNQCIADQKCNLPGDCYTNVCTNGKCV